MTPAMPRLWRTTRPCVVCLSLFFSTAWAEDWPRWRGALIDGQWRETGLVDKFDGPELPRRWTAEIGSGYTGPTVAAGRVLVMDRQTEPEPIERVLCFDMKTGEPKWSHAYACEYDGVSYTAGPRASVTIESGLAYALGATGHLHCLDLETGEVQWHRDLRVDFQIRMPTWGISGSPLIEGNHVIVQIGGDDGACIVALNKRTGETIWKSLSDDASYSSLIAIDQAGYRVIVCWTGERVVGVDAKDGAQLWEYPYRWEKWPIGIATPVVSGPFLLISEVHKGSLLLRLGQDKPTVEKVWHQRENGDPALHCLMSTPLIIDGYIYGADGKGVLRCLELQSGKQVWEDESAVPIINWATIHMVQNGDRVWMLNDRGELILSRLSPQGFEQLSRAKLLDPTTAQLRRRDGVTWSHPAFADRAIFARNDKELVRADLDDSSGTMTSGTTASEIPADVKR